MLEEEPLREGVFHLVGVAHHVGGVEAGDGREVIDPGNEAILQLRLDGVAQVAAEEPFQGGRLEIPNQRRRPQLEAGLQIGAIDARRFPARVWCCWESGSGCNRSLAPLLPAAASSRRGGGAARGEGKDQSARRLLFVARLTAAQSGCGTIHAPTQPASRGATARWCRNQDWARAGCESAVCRRCCPPG